MSTQRAGGKGNRGVVYTLHLWPPLAHAQHYTGGASRGRLVQRLTDHALGRGARMLQVQLERGGSWVLGNIQTGGFERERELKAMHKGSLHCDVCKAVKNYQSGQLSPAQALSRAGWNRASEHEQSLLLKIFGLPSAPEKVPEHDSSQVEFLPDPKPLARTPEIDAVVDALIAGWSPKADAEAEPDPAASARPGNFPGRGATPQTEREIEATA